MFRSNPQVYHHDSKIFGDGSTWRDFTFVSDVVDAIRFFNAFSENESAVLNVGTGTGTSLKQLVMHLSKDGRAIARTSRRRPVFGCEHDALRPHNRIQG
ncbi:MAG: NAD-dependent epimerase/dehydratase family protein [Nannocystis sp.]|nr:NAD-dependent epimerase/dehydratase family protein [Nannocystis sp.]